MGRSADKEADPDLGILLANAMFRFQGEMFRRAAAEGFDDITPRHGAVTAYLDFDGIRSSELARLSGRHKQAIGVIVDELEQLGYVTRASDPTDRRAKLVVPTERGRALMRLNDGIADDIEKRHRDRIGGGSYDQFKAVLRGIVAAQSPES